MTPLRRDLVWLFVVGIAVRALTMVPMAHPGYMDAAYSYDIALNLARGNGLNEPFLWHYLDDPVGLPHPSHLYWMPLPTLLAWLGIALLGHSYRAAQVPFIVLAACLPVVSYTIAWHVSQRRLLSWVAGLLTIFSGYYVVYWGHTDNFAPFALAGSLSLLAGWLGVENPQPSATPSPAGEGEQPSSRIEHDEPPLQRLWPAWLLGAGALAALAHLSRADGVLVLAVVAAGVAWQMWRSPRRLVTDLGWLAGGYAVVMAPWFSRNLLVVGTPLPAGGAQTIWLTRYDELFSYGRELSVATYLAWGWDNILSSKLQALWLNAQTAIAVVGMVFLAPLALIGAWRLRRHGLIRLAGGYALLLFAIMTFVFTFPGPRGGLFHSGGSLLPYVTATAVVGLEALVGWVARRRRTWNPAVAGRVFAVGLVGLAVLMSAVVIYRGVLVSSRWRVPDVTYQQLNAWLAGRGEPDALVMVGDPATYWYVSGAPAIVVPDGTPETAVAAAERYGARYLVLDANHPLQLALLYAGELSLARLSPVHSFEDASGRPVRVFEILR
jgi:hypothetical protein